MDFKKLEEKAQAFNDFMKDNKLFLIPPGECFLCRGKFNRDHKMTLEFSHVMGKDVLGWAHARCAKKSKPSQTKVDLSASNES